MKLEIDVTSTMFIKSLDYSFLVNGKIKYNEIISFMVVYKR
jgi:hypothetical protein